MKIVVIGSISAGISAATSLAGADPAAKIVVYEKSYFYSCGGCGLPHYLTVSNEELQAAIQEKEAELAANRIEAHLGCEVTGIDVRGRRLQITELSGGRTFSDSFDKLVVATGGNKLIPKVSGSNRVGIHTLKNVEDLIFLKEFTRTPYVRDIVILGAGYAGLEVAKAFVQMGRKVRIIEKERQILPDFDKEVSALIQKGLEEAGVTFCLGETVTAFPGRTYVEEVKTNRGSYPCDLCISCIGVAPNTSLLAGSGIALSSAGAILVDDKMQTNLPGIYAIGECTTQTGPMLKTASLRAAGMEIARTGINEEQARKAGLRVRSAMATGKDRPGICPGAHSISIKLIYDASSRVVLGAQLWGGKNVACRANAIAVAIAAKMTVEDLANVDFAYSSRNNAVWDPIQIVCLSAK